MQDISEKYWGQKKYKYIQAEMRDQHKMIQFSNKEKLEMTRDIHDYIIKHKYILYHDFMNDISESHQNWFNMLTFDRAKNKFVLKIIKSLARQNR